MIRNILNSNLLLVSLVLIPIVLASLRKKGKTVLFLALAYSTTFFTGFTIKRITAIPRPFDLQPQVLGVTSEIPTDYSFPSLHTMLTTIFAWGMTMILPQFSWLWFGINLIIALSRVFLGVHYYRDLFFGFIFATIIYWIFFFAFNRKELVKPNSNLKRKLIHMLFGITLVTMFRYNLLTINQFGLLFFIAGPIMMIINLPGFGLLKKCVLHFERDKNTVFPGLGVFWYLLSSLMVLLLFQKSIALAAIANLAVGDSVNALTGWFHHKPARKLIGPSVAAFFTSILIVMNFVSPARALVGVLTASVLEFVGPKIKGKRVDDNIWIPIVSALAMASVGA